MCSKRAISATPAPPPNCAKTGDCATDSWRYSASRQMECGRHRHSRDAQVRGGLFLRMQSNPIANFDLRWTTDDIVNIGQCRRGDCSMSSVRDSTTGFAVIGTILLGLRKGPRGAPKGGLGTSQPSPEIKAQVLSRDGDGCGRLSAAVPFTAGPRFRISFAPTESRCRRGSAVHSIGRFAYRREPLSTRTIDPVVCVRYVTQAITALATSSASTARFNGAAAAAAAIISSVRPGTKPVWTIP